MVLQLFLINIHYTTFQTLFNPSELIPEHNVLLDTSKDNLIRTLFCSLPQSREYRRKRLHDPSYSHIL